MFHYFNIDHKFTGGLGLGMILSPNIDQLSRFLGVVALLVSIYCSISRNEREKRADRELRENWVANRPPR